MRKSRRKLLRENELLRQIISRNASEMRDVKMRMRDAEAELYNINYRESFEIPVIPKLERGGK